MTDLEKKPLNWSPVPGIGYTVSRREDGGMHYVFTDLSHPTLKHWREFALAHLLDSDRLTRNLYDLRQVSQVPKDAVQYALEVSSDPSTRNIRAAVVVSGDEVRRAVREFIALTGPGGVEISVFSAIDEAEAWLSRPLTMLI